MKKEMLVGLLCIAIALFVIVLVYCVFFVGNALLSGLLIGGSALIAVLVASFVYDKIEIKKTEN